MKKLFLLLLAALGTLAMFVWKRGTLTPLLTVAAIIPLCLGVLFTTLFSFSFKEIGDAFQTAFSAEINPNSIQDYHKNLLIVKNLQAATLNWAATLLVMAVILILSDLTTPAKLGPSLAIAFCALFYGFGLKAALFIPMEHNLQKKVFLTSTG